MKLNEKYKLPVIVGCRRFLLLWSQRLLSCLPAKISRSDINLYLFPLFLRPWNRVQMGSLHFTYILNLERELLFIFMY